MTLKSRLGVTRYAYPLPPLGHMWDVMLDWRKGNIERNGLCVTIIMVHKGTSSSYRSVDYIGLWSCLV